MASPRLESVTTDFNIMLWNVSSRNPEQGMATQILCSMDKILQALVTDTQNYSNMMCLCTDQISRKKASILRGMLQGREIPNIEAEVYWAEGMTVEYLEPDCRRLTVISTTDRKGEKTLVASWHGPNPKPVGKGHRANIVRRWTAHGYERANPRRHQYPVRAAAVRIVKYRECLDMLKRLEGLKMKHGCSAAIVGGDFNLTPDVVRGIVEKDLPDLHVEVADDYASPKDRPNKLDFLVYWPKWAFIVKSTNLIAENLRCSEDKMIVFDHPIVMYSLQDCSRYDLDGHVEVSNVHVAVRKWEIMKTGAAFTFSCSSPAMTDIRAEQILNKLKLGQLYRVEGSAVLQAPDGSADPDGESETVCLPTQLFLSKRHSCFTSLVQFDRRVRSECARQEDCTTVFGVFPMIGYVRKAHAMAQHREECQNKKKIRSLKRTASSGSTPKQEVANASSVTSNTPIPAVQKVSSRSTANVAAEGIATVSGVRGHDKVAVNSPLTAISSKQRTISTHHERPPSVTQPGQDPNAVISADVMKCAPQTDTQQTTNTTNQRELDKILAEVTPPQNGTDPSLASWCVPGSGKKDEDCGALQNRFEHAAAGSVYSTDSCMQKPKTAKKHHTPNDTKTDGLNLQESVTQRSKFPEQQQTNTPSGNPKSLKYSPPSPPVNAAKGGKRKMTDSNNGPDSGSRKRTALSSRLEPNTLPLNADAHRNPTSTLNTHLSPEHNRTVTGSGLNVPMHVKEIPNSSKQPGQTQCANDIGQTSADVGSKAFCAVETSLDGKNILAVRAVTQQAAEQAVRAVTQQAAEQTVQAVTQQAAEQAVRAVTQQAAEQAVRAVTQQADQQQTNAKDPVEEKMMSMIMHDLAQDLSHNRDPNKIIWNIQL